MNKDAINVLRDKLNDRPSPSSLLENHILQAPVSLAPALHASSVMIENALDHRPKKEELVTINVLKNITVANSLQSNADSLQKAIASDALKHNLSNRNDQVPISIMPAQGIAPALQKNAVELEKAIKRDSLKKGMEDRSEISNLYDSNILKNSTIASKLQATANDLEKSIKGDLLKKVIQN